MVGKKGGRFVESNLSCAVAMRGGVNFSLDSSSAEE